MADIRIDLGIDLSRLPKKVQAFIGSLENENARLRRQLAEYNVSTGESEIVAHPYSDVPRSLGNRAVVQFGKLEVTYGDGVLDVRGVGGILESFVVMPCAANAVQIRHVPRPEG